MSKKDPGIEVVGQIVGHKSLKVAGGLRVEIDFFDARPEDVCHMTLLSIDKKVVKLNILPHEEKDDGEKSAPKEYRVK